MKYSSLLFLILLLPGCKTEPSFELAWSDEFNYEGMPDPDKWTYEKGYIRNSELQCYTDQPKNVQVEDGRCLITLCHDRGATDSITSASINTLGKMDFLYGRMEVKAKIPSALGTWPAIWMLGVNIGEVGWPGCGEIDIMEHVGFEPDVIHGTTHTAAKNHILGNAVGGKIREVEPWREYHIYAVEWSPDKMDFFYDDSLYHSIANTTPGDERGWPFDAPHYLLINLAYGGGWSGVKGVDISALPLDYEIDYVRYYRLNNIK